MEFKAIGFRVHVKPDQTETERLAKRSGIVLADSNDRRSDQNAVDSGVVLAIGPDAWAEYAATEPWCKVGDKIVYARHAGYRVGDGDDTVLIVNDADVVTVIKEAQ